MLSPAPIVASAPVSFRLRENVPLAPFTTFGIGGPARWFASVTTEEEIAEACAWAAASSLPIFVLGGGSNVLVADSGFPGLVVHIALRGVSERAERAKRVFRAAAGEDWDALVTRTVEAGCAGMECLAGIPGTVGGTPVQNVGAYGQEVSQTIVSVRCFDRINFMFNEFSGTACGFGYRTSRFNQLPDRGRYIVTSVEFALEPGGTPSLAYADLQRAFAGRAEAPSLAEVAHAVREIRRAKGMVIDVRRPLLARDPDTRSAGSFFKNPVAPDSFFRTIEASVAPARTPGGAALSGKHTLALTKHSGHASAAEIAQLRDAVVQGVEARFGVRLEPEPVPVGEF